MIGVGADEHPPAAIVGDHLVFVGVFRSAQSACLYGVDGKERMIVEIERAHLGPRWNGVDAFLPARAEQLQRGHPVHLRIVEGRDRRGRHQIPPVDHHRVIVTDGYLPEPRHVLVQLHMHQPVIGEAVHAFGLGPSRFQPVQRLGLRHLINKNLVLAQGFLGDAVAGLDHARLRRARGGRHPGGAGEEMPDGDGVGGVVGALVDDLQRIVRTEHGGRHLNAASAPAMGQRHLA